MIAWACIIAVSVTLLGASVWLLTHDDWWEARR